MERVYYRSDIEVRLTFRNAAGERISCPDRVRAVFRTNSGRRELDLCGLLSFDNEDGSLNVWLPLSRYDIGIGRLYVKRPNNAEYYIDDPGIILTDESYDSGLIQTSYKG